MITRLTHTFIYVLNLDRAIDFYTKKLGLKIQQISLSMAKDGLPFFHLNKRNWSYYLWWLKKV